MNRIVILNVPKQKYFQPKNPLNLLKEVSGLVEELGGEGTVPDPGGVGLHHAKHVANKPRLDYITQ